MAKIRQPYNDSDIQAAKAEKYLINKLRAIRKVQNVTQSDLDAVCGMNQSSVCRFERSDPDYKCSFRVFLKVAHALGYEIELKPVSEKAIQAQKFESFFSSSDTIPQDLSLPEKLVYKSIHDKGETTRSQLIKELEFSSRTIDRTLISLLGRQLISESGDQLHRVWTIKK